MHLKLESELRRIELNRGVHISDDIAKACWHHALLLYVTL
jgi:hypothetical protein